MIQSKKINIIIAIAVISAFIISVAFVLIGNIQQTNANIKKDAEYSAKLFGTDIISLEILADEKDWKEMLENAISEQYIMADVIVNGTKFKNVGIRPKGNSSLTQVAGSDSNRYSFRLQFNEYIKEQTCFGLESFVVNNMLGDNTYMKEYVSYELMQEMGVDSPYFGYADIKVNGESWGLYLAVELYNDSFEQRVFGDTTGMLYNVKSMDMGGDNKGGMPGQQDGNMPAMPDAEGKDSIPQSSNDESNADSQQQHKIQPNGQDNMGQQSIPSPSPQDNTEQQPVRSIDSNTSSDINSPSNTDRPALPEQMEGEMGDLDKAFGGKGERGSSGGSLEYTDDNTESYSAIFNNVVGKGTTNDYQRVVEALKALSEGKELEKYFDVDQILRYFAVHTIVVNLDSYSSSMAQNYYIYESEGKLTILPWDYNLAWGGFQSGSASSVINFPIDTPVKEVEMSSRPLLEKLFANTEYLERYHHYLQQLIDKYFANGKFESKINSIDTLISNYVKNDSTAFCTFDEYKTAVSAFISLGNLRAQSIQGQLDGTIPATTEEQNKNTDGLISAGNLKLSELGSMMGGKGGINSDFSDRRGGQDKNTASNALGGMSSGLDKELMDKAMGIIMKSNGEITDEVKENLLSIGLTTEQIEQLSTMSSRRFGGMEKDRQTRNTLNSADASAPVDPKATANNSIYLIGVLSIILIAALLFAAKFRKIY